MLIAAALAVGLASPALAQGTLRVAVGSTLNNLDPAKTTIGDEYIFVHLVFNGLTRIDRDLTTKPDLAVSWTASDDLKTWTFKLRHDVKFSNGDKVTAKDFIYSWSRAAKLQGDYAAEVALVDGYKDVKAKKATTLSGMTAPDDYTLVVKLSEPGGYFVTQVAFFTAVTAVVSQKAIEAGGEDTWWTKPETLSAPGLTR